MKKHCLAALVLALSLSGCATVTMTENGGTTTTSQPDFEDTHAFYIAGLLPEVQSVDTASLCPSGVRQLQTLTTFENGLVGVVSFGIYTPKTSKVWCKD